MTDASNSDHNMSDSAVMMPPAVVDSIHGNDASDTAAASNDEPDKITTRLDHSYLALPEEHRITVLRHLLKYDVPVSLDYSYSGGYTIPRSFLVNSTTSGLVQANKHASLDVQFVFLETNTIIIEDKIALEWYWEYLHVNPRLLRAIRSVAIPEWNPSADPLLPSRAMELLRNVKTLRTLKIGLNLHGLCYVGYYNTMHGIWVHSTHEISQLLRDLFFTSLPLLSALECLEIKIRGWNACKVHTQDLVKEASTFLVVEFARLYWRKLNVTVIYEDWVNNGVVDAHDVDKAFGPVGPMHLVD